MQCNNNPHQNKSNEEGARSHINNNNNEIKENQQLKHKSTSITYNATYLPDKHSHLKYNKSTDTIKLLNEIWET